MDKFINQLSGIFKRLLNVFIIIWVVVFAAKVIDDIANYYKYKQKYHAEKQHYTDKLEKYSLWLEDNTNLKESEDYKTVEEASKNIKWQIDLVYTARLEPENMVLLILGLGFVLIFNYVFFKRITLWHKSK